MLFPNLDVVSMTDADRERYWAPDSLLALEASSYKLQSIAITEFRTQFKAYIDELCKFIRDNKFKKTTRELTRELRSLANKIHQIPDNELVYCIQEFDQTEEEINESIEMLTTMLAVQYGLPINNKINKEARKIHDQFTQNRAKFAKHKANLLEFMQGLVRELALKNKRIAWVQHVPSHSASTPRLLPEIPSIAIPTFPTWSPKKYPPEVVLSRAQTRIETIISKKINEEHIQELEDINERLVKLAWSIDWTNPLHVNISNTISQVSLLLEAWIDAENNTQWYYDNGTQQILEDTAVIAENDTIRDSILWEIRELRVWILTFKESSKLWWESEWDGNFVAHVFRPFLTLVESVVKNWLNTSDFSWNECVQKIRNSHSGLESRKRLNAFLFIVSTSEERLAWEENKMKILEFVVKYTENDNFFSVNNEGMRLSNIRKKLSALQ